MDRLETHHGEDTALFEGGGTWDSGLGVESRRVDPLDISQHVCRVCAGTWGNSAHLLQSATVPPSSATGTIKIVQHPYRIGSVKPVI